MFESLVFARRDKVLARRLVSLPMALAVQAGLMATFLLYSLLAKEVLQPPERAWAAIWNQAPRVTLMGGAAAPKPKHAEPARAAAPRDDRLKPPAEAPEGVRPSKPDELAAEPLPEGTVIDGALPGLGSGGNTSLPLPTEAPSRRIVIVGPNLTPPRLIQQVPPAYPPAARVMGLTGRVVLQLTVDEEGRVEDVQVVTSTNPIFVGPAVEAVRRWRYSRPVDVAGQRVACSMFVTISFALS